VSHCHAQIFVGIDWSLVDADFVVEVRTGAPAAEADVADDFAAMHVLSGSDRETGQVAEAGIDSAAMVDHDGFPDLYIANGMISGISQQDLNSFFWRQVVANSPDQAKPSHDYEQGWSAINELIRRTEQRAEGRSDFPRLKTSPHGYLVIAGTGHVLTQETVRESSEDEDVSY